MMSGAGRGVRRPIGIRMEVGDANLMAPSPTAGRFDRSVAVCGGEAG